MLLIVLIYFTASVLLLNNKYRLLLIRLLKINNQMKLRCLKFLNYQKTI